MYGHDICTACFLLHIECTSVDFFIVPYDAQQVSSWDSCLEIQEKAKSKKKNASCTLREDLRETLFEGARVVCLRIIIP